MKNDDLMVPRLRFSGFEVGWESKRLGSLIEIKGRIGYRGYTTNDIVNKGEGAISLSPSNIDEYGAMKFDKVTYITWIKFEESPEIILEHGYTVLVKTGSTYGKSALVKKLPEKATINPQIVVLKPKQIHDIFLSIIVQNDSVQKQIEETVVGGAIPTLSQENISNFTVTLPTLPEQEKIAAFLTLADEKINQLARKKQLLETYKKGVMQGLFSQKVRFSGFEGEWEVKYGNELFESISDKDHNSDLPILAITQEFGAIPRDLIDFKITVTDKSIDSYKVVKKGDFIISLRSFQGGIEYSEYEGICSPAYIILRRCCMDKLNLEKVRF